VGVFINPQHEEQNFTKYTQKNTKYTQISVI